MKGRMINGRYVPKGLKVYVRTCNRCDEIHKTTTKSSCAICPKCKKKSGSKK